MPLRETRQISTKEIKSKPGNGTKFHCYVQLFLGNGNIAMIPMHLVDTFFKILAYHEKIALHVTEQNPSLEIRQK